MSRFYSLQIASVTPETRDAIAVFFVVPEDLESAFRFVQGQHLTLRMVIDGHEVRRSYSICSATQDAHMRIAIKRVAGGFFSNWANDHLKAGASVEMVPPSGHFHVALDASQARHYLAIAAGSGITPIFSIVKTTLAAEPASRVTLIYANRASSTVLFRDELADLKDAYLTRFNLIHVL